MIRLTYKNKGVVGTIEFTSWNAYKSWCECFGNESDMQLVSVGGVIQ